MKENNRIAIIYDFDNTLISGNMQEGSYMEMLGVTKDEYWSFANKLTVENNMDSILAAMYAPIIIAKEKGIKFGKEILAVAGKKISTFYKGVEQWFDRINEFARSLNLEVEHYVISAGLTEMVENCKIADKFRKVFSCNYIYDKNGEAVWPAQFVNYTLKTQYISRIRKHLLDDLYDSKEINKKYEISEEYISYKHMIYIGDGETDVPGMRMVKENGGKGICVYEKGLEKAKATAIQLVKDERADYAVEADYREGKELDSRVKKFILEFSKDIKNRVDK